MSWLGIQPILKNEDNNNIVTDTNGVVRISKTRFIIDTVVTAFQEGATAEEMKEQYPLLQLSDIYSVIGYYLRHQAEVDEYLLERQRLAEDVRQEAERRFNPVGIRSSHVAIARF